MDKVFNQIQTGPNPYNQCVLSASIIASKPIHKTPMNQHFAYMSGVRYFWVLLNFRRISLGIQLVLTLITCLQTCKLE